MKDPEAFKYIFDSVRPEEEKLPEPWDSKLDRFQKMIILKAFRSDKIVIAIENWITAI